MIRCRNVSIPQKTCGSNIRKSKRQGGYLKKAHSEPFARKIRLTFVDLQKGYAKVAKVFTPDMENIFGTAHGGASGAD